MALGEGFPLPGIAENTCGGVRGSRDIIEIEELEACKVSRKEVLKKKIMMEVLPEFCYEQYFY